VTIRKLTDAFRETLQSPEVNGKLTVGGFEVMATDGPGADRHARQEYERWSAFVRTTKLKIDE
jgi:tripartite-type tricarboxylate transporter receptor subunit TctC